MEMLRQEKIEMYEELQLVSLGHDFLKASFEEINIEASHVTRGITRLHCPTRRDALRHICGVVDR